jgi:hypothetical protein
MASKGPACPGFFYFVRVFGAKAGLVLAHEMRWRRIRAREPSALPG